MLERKREADRERQKRYRARKAAARAAEVGADVATVGGAPPDHAALLGDIHAMFQPQPERLEERQAAHQRAGGLERRQEERQARQRPASATSAAAAHMLPGLVSPPLQQQQPPVTVARTTREKENLPSRSFNAGPGVRAAGGGQAQFKFEAADLSPPVFRHPSCRQARPPYGPTGR
jgi:pyruvate/2-oxoglutarate dehydrogenase complex dihydrolipoamide acyltransferase (E2) component